MFDPWEKLLKDMVDQGGPDADLARETLEMLKPGAGGQPPAPADSPAPASPPVSPGETSAPSPPSAAGPVAPIPGTTVAGSPLEIVRIELNQLQWNPAQPRKEVDSDELRGLAQNIAANGLLQPISVRKVPSGSKPYQIIYGHRRVMAYGQLYDNASTSEERERYRAIPAQVMSDVSDAQMLLYAFSENMERSSLTPLEAADALAELRQFYPGVKTAKDVSKLTGLDVSKVERHLRLAKAPAVVRAGAKEGILIPVEDPNDDRPENERRTEQRRTLDLLGALEFARLHDFLKEDGGKPSALEEADAKTRDAIQRALKEDWGLRQIQQFVDQTMAGKKRQPKRGRPKVPFKRGRNQLVIYPTRLANFVRVAEKRAA